MKNLEVVYGYQKSFYGKAKTYQSEDGRFEYLYSYGTLIGTLDRQKDTIELTKYCYYSNTTVRHVKDWLLQKNIRPDRIYIKGVPLKTWNRGALREVQNHIINTTSKNYF